MEKLLAMNVAALLTEAACGGSPGNLPVSADLSDNQVRAKNLQTWETFRVFYNAIVGALADSQSWPDPAINPGNFLPGLVASLAPLVTGTGPLAPVIGTLLQVLNKTAAAIPTPPVSVPPPATPLPNPGQVAQTPRSRT